MDRRTVPALMALALSPGLALAQPAPAGAPTVVVAPQVAPTVAPTAAPVAPVAAAPSSAAAPAPAVPSAPAPAAVAPAPVAAGTVIMLPAGTAPGAVPPGYVMLVPWTPPGQAAASSATPAPFAAPEPTTRTVDYGWMTTVTDLSALGLVLLAIPTRSSLPSSLGVATYAFGAPIVHWSNGNVGRGFGSLGLRVGGPMVGVFVGAAVGGCFRDHSSASSDDSFDDLGSCLVGASLGSLAGLTGALIIDHVLPSTKEVPIEKKTVSWSPTVVPSKQGGSLGMVGAW